MLTGSAARPPSGQRSHDAGQHNHESTYHRTQPVRNRRIQTPTTPPIVKSRVTVGRYDAQTLGEVFPQVVEPSVIIDILRLVQGVVLNAAMACLSAVQANALGELSELT